MDRKVNYIIVGQGLAGAVFAQSLLKRGKSLVVIDDSSPSIASSVAAGLYNPIVFKRLLKSWKIDDLLLFMNSFYPEMEKLLDARFYFSKRLFKPFAEEQEKVLWFKKIEEPIGKYLSKNIIEGDLNGLISNPIGISEVLHSGNLDIRLFLNFHKNFLKSKELFLEEKFDYGKIVFRDKNVTYKEITADKIIFCEGYKATENPYFKWLPFKLTKGETLTIRLGDGFSIPEDVVINKAVFILPQGNNTYKVGATYEWDDLSESPTEKGSSELVEKLQKTLKVPFEIIDHQAGIRPTVIDRRPLIGLHPAHPQLAVFNGMGTKGVMLAPYFANHFVDFLECGSPLDAEVDIARFQ